MAHAIRLGRVLPFGKLLGGGQAGRMTWKARKKAKAHAKAARKAVVAKR